MLAMAEVAKAHEYSLIGRLTGRREKRALRRSVQCPVRRCMLGRYRICAGLSSFFGWSASMGSRCMF